MRRRSYYRPKRQYDQIIGIMGNRNRTPHVSRSKEEIMADLGITPELMAELEAETNNNSVNIEIEKENKMSLIVSDNGKDFERVPEGTHLATCYMIVDVGTQKTIFNGAEKWIKKVVLGWELTGELMSDGKPFTITQRYTASLGSKAALRRDLDSWRGKAFTEEEAKAFPLVNVMGKGCMLSIVHEESNGKTYTNIKTVMGLPKGTTVAPLVNSPVLFDLDEFDHDVFESLPSWLKTYINASKERSPIALEVQQQTVNGEFNDIPF